MLVRYAESVPALCLVREVHYALCAERRTVEPSLSRQSITADEAQYLEHCSATRANRRECIYENNGCNGGRVFRHKQLRVIFYLA